MSKSFIGLEEKEFKELLAAIDWSKVNFVAPVTSSLLILSDEGKPRTVEVEERVEVILSHLVIKDTKEQKLDINHIENTNKKQ